jgi:peptidoglycan hydrolase-like protein with peptidoglycan-binding domain
MRSTNCRPSRGDKDMALLRRGLSGEPVRILQTKLGVNADGVFGQGTENALIEYQKANGLSADGIAGPDTFTHMGLHELVLVARGIRGDMVKRVQTALSVGSDGEFGHGTEAAVKKFQSENSLEATGAADPATLAAMPGFPEFTPEKVAASVVSESTPAVDAEALASAKAEPPPEPSFVAKVEHGLVAAATAPIKSIWNTVKSIF